MRSLTVLSRPALLAVAAAGLIAAFVLAPPVLAGGDYADEQHLVGALRGAFVTYWQSGQGDLTPDLAGITDYWFRYHVAKGAIAALLLVVLVVLLRRTSRKLVLVPVTALAGLALVTVMANVQGMVAPFASLLPMVVDGAGGGQVVDGASGGQVVDGASGGQVVDGASGAAISGTLEQIRQGLTAGDQTPALQAMVGDFGRYHEAMVAIAGLVAIGLLAAGVLLWRRSARAFGVVSALLSLAVATVAVANTTVAADPTPALLAFFDGGW